MNRIDRELLPLGVLLVAASLLVACSGGGGGDGGGGGGGGTTPQFGTVSGQVTAGAAGVQGVIVSVGGSGSTTTDAGGSFSVANVPVGGRTVTIIVPSGYIMAAAGDPMAKSVSVGASATATVSFALKRGVQVTAIGTTFSPENVTVPTGGTVRWVGSGGGPHTVSQSPGNPAGGWADAALPNGATMDHTFNAAGTFNYFCAPHQAMGMTGRVTVGG